MEEKRGMGRIGSVWNQVSGARIPINLVPLLLLGALAYLLFRHSEALSPVEGALLIMVAAGFLHTGLHWWDWQLRLTRDGSLADWVQRIHQGERKPHPPRHRTGRRTDARDKDG